MAAPRPVAAAHRPASSAPDDASFWFELGNAHLRAGKCEEAISAFDAALRLRPNFPEALRTGGVLLRDRGSNEAALRFLDEAIRLQPDYHDAVLDKSNLLQALGRLDEAVATLDAAIAFHPCDAGLLSNKGSLLHSLGRFPEAEAAFHAALTADPALPQAHLNYAGLLMRQFRHAEALPLLDRAIALKARYVAAHSNRGLTLKMLGRFEEASAALDQAVALAPGDPYALTNRGELRLLLGDYAKGWADYQARFATQEQHAFLPKTSVPFWSGQPLQGLKVLAAADAGNGDVIHFARYVPMLVAARAIVTVVCRPRLQRLLAPVLRGTRVVAELDECQDFDRLVPFTNLPFLFATTAEAVPGGSPYLEAETHRVETWRRRIGSDGFKIGLCWRGSQDWRADPNRSIPLGAFLPLASLPNVRLIALNVDSEDAAACPFSLERFQDLDTGPDAFVDTAAVMACLDLIVTIDTSIAHLAGALGRPTDLLLRKVPEWRWLLDRDDTPWYPTMRLFRQQSASDWTVPLTNVVEGVRRMLPTSRIGGV